MRLVGSSGSLRARARPAPAPIALIERQLIIDGQSLVLYPLGAGVSASEALAALLPATWWPNIDVVAVASTTYPQREADVATRVDALIDGSRPSVLIDVAGTSDLYQSGDNQTAAQTLTRATDYAADRRTAGVDVYVIATVPPSNIFSGGANTQRLAYNNLLHQSAAFDAVCDLAALPEAADPGDGTYYADGLHPTEALAAIFAAEMERTLGAVRFPT